MGSNEEILEDLRRNIYRSFQFKTHDIVDRIEDLIEFKINTALNIERSNLIDYMKKKIENIEARPYSVEWTSYRRRDCLEAYREIVAELEVK